MAVQAEVRLICDKCGAISQASITERIFLRPHPNIPALEKMGREEGFRVRVIKGFKRMLCPKCDSLAR